MKDCYHTTERRKGKCNFPEWVGLRCKRCQGQVWGSEAGKRGKSKGKKKSHPMKSLKTGQRVNWGETEKVSNREVVKNNLFQKATCLDNKGWPGDEVKKRKQESFCQKDRHRKSATRHEAHFVKSRFGMKKALEKQSRKGLGCLGGGNT